MATPSRKAAYSTIRAVEVGPVRSGANSLQNNPALHGHIHHQSTTSVETTSVASNLPRVQSNLHVIHHTVVPTSQSGTPSNAVSTRKMALEDSRVANSKKANMPKRYAPEVNRGSDEDSVAKAKSSSRGGKCAQFWSIRMLASGLCAVFIIITAICLLVVTFNFSMSAAQDIAEQHAVSIATKAKSNVEALLNKPLAAAAGWQYVMSKGNHPLPMDAEAANPLWYRDYWEQFIGSMSATDFSYQFAVFGFSDGNYAGCKNMPGETFQCRLFGKNQQNQSALCHLYEETYHRSNYSLITANTGLINYDPRTRAWYKMVDHRPFAMKWSTAYLSAMPTLPIIDVNAALFNASGHHIGVISMTFELGLLSGFLSDLQTTENTVSVLIDNEDLLLASSYKDAYLTQTKIPVGYNGPVGDNCLVSDSSNSADDNLLVCRAAVSSYTYAPLPLLAASYPSLVRNGAEGAQRIRLAGTDYFVSVVPVSTELAEGMHWRFALFVPQSDIVSGIIQGRDISIYLSVAIVAVAVGLCFVILTLLMAPLQAVTESMYRLATLQTQDEDDEGPKSSLYEIATIQGAFMVMSEELTKVKSFLPQSVLAQLYGGPTDDDEDVFEDEVSAPKKNGNHNESTSDASMVRSARSTVRNHVINGDTASDSTAQQARKQAASTIISAHSNKKSRKAALFTNVSISTRRVTMLAVNIASYHQHVVGADAASVMAASAEVVGVVSAAVNEFRGVLDGFQGDKFMSSFNAVTAVGNHAAAAAGAALLCNASLGQLKISGKPLRMTAGIASGPAMVGNMGTLAVRRFTVLGHVVTNAGILERLCKRYPDTHTLIGGNAINDTKNFFELLTLDVVVLHFNAAGPRRTTLAALKAASSGVADEWMYALANANQASRYTEINEAFGFFVDGDAGHAAAMMERVRETADLVNDTCLAVTVEHLMNLLSTVTEGSEYVNTLPDFFAECMVTGAFGAIPKVL